MSHADPQNFSFEPIRRILRQHRLASIGLLALGLLALVATLRLSVFMVDPARAEMSLVPKDPFFTRHSCLSSYFVGARVITEPSANIYFARHYEGDQNYISSIGSFDQDPFQYPPLILLPFQVLAKLDLDFIQTRALWFFLEALVTLGGLLLAAAWIGGRIGAVAVLLIPLVWLSPANLVGLQFGNVQPLILMAAVAGMIAIASDRKVFGGGLLALAIVTKIFPGILAIYLLAKRDWRSVFATAAFSTLFAALVVVSNGPSPWLDFVTYQMPRISNGEAFKSLFEAAPLSKLLNLSFSSLPFKISQLGLIEADAISRSAATIGTILTVLGALILGLIDRGGQTLPGETDRAARLLGWLAILNLSTLQATMSPIYAALGTVWLLTLWAARRREGSIASTIALLGTALLALSVAIPNFGLAAVVLILLTQLVNLGVNFAVLTGRVRAWLRQAPSV